MSIELDPNNAIEESERSDPSGVFNKISLVVRYGSHSAVLAQFC
ncbi:MAG TPA: hypothetical protein PKA82_15030 [Pyrinomonadaceae bacterium]|nr:hypothetical protein [Pyrinomonadaceae bacterium]